LASYAPPVSGGAFSSVISWVPRIPGGKEFLKNHGLKFCKSAMAELLFEEL
jgi:hypothetical protein